MRFKLSAVFLVIILVVCAVFAQVVDLTGKVLEKNKPVAGVIATLSGTGVSDITGPDGVYHLVDGTEIKASQVNSYQLEIKGCQILFSVYENQRVSIDIFNLKGKKVVSVLNRSLSGGRYSIVPDMSKLAIGFYAVLLKMGNVEKKDGFINMRQKERPLTRMGDGWMNETSVASSMWQGDTLVLLKDGQTISKAEILDLTDTLADVFIFQRDINGPLQVTGDAIWKIEAVLTGDSISDLSPKVVELWHNVANNSYSGYVCLLDSSNYNVFVKIYDNDEKFIGRSVDVSFPTSLAGDIEIPVFDLDNAKPTVSLGVDTTVSIYDTIYFQAVVVDSFRTREIVKWEWDFGSGFVEGSDDTAIVAPDSRFGNITTAIKVTDIDGNVATDIKVVTVVKDIPIPTASITGDFIWSGEQIELKGTATDQYGSIVKWEWDFGSGFIQTSTGDTLTSAVTGGHEYVLRVTDDDGNVAVDTADIGILGISGKMSFIPAKGKMYWMGASRLNMGPAHEVWFTYNFWMDTTEVAQSDYESVMGVNPSNWQTPNYPVENITWFDAVLYCNARSKGEGLLDTVYSYTAVLGVPGDSTYELTDLATDMSKSGYRLPTEAEWEFACKAQWGGQEDDYEDYYWGNVDGSLYCWNSINTTNIVGAKLPNKFRLYDMSGNVGEWSNNWWENNYTGANYGIDPIGPTEDGGGRTIRGGDFSMHYRTLYSACRVKNRINRDNSTGFRVVRAFE